MTIGEVEALPQSGGSVIGAMPAGVQHLVYQGRDVYIIGTAHISQRSVIEVRQLIDAVRPDTVCVELDATRYAAMTDESRWRKLDIFQVIRQGKVLFLVSSLALSAYQRRLGDKLGVMPGAELKAAIEAAEIVGAKLVLADRDIQATLKRSWANLSLWEKANIISLLLTLGFTDHEVTEEQIEHLKDRDHLGEVMREFARSMPRLQCPLIDERDRYLMSSVQEASGKTIVAVVGAGHVEGMLSYLGQEVDRGALEVIPPPSLWWKLAQWTVPLILVVSFYFGYAKHSGEGLLRMVFAWWLPNATCSALFGVAALARPLTVLSAFVASPIAALNPAISVGMITGLVEAWLRKPTVEDCERIPADIETLRGIYRNPCTRVMLVAVLTTLGSVVGTWIGLTWVITLLAR